jgi:hypothetical protein
VERGRSPVALEKELAMPYMNAFEKRGLEKGTHQGAMDLLKFQLEQRFGPLPQFASDQLEHGSQTDLKRWGAALLSAPTLDEVFAAH